MKVHLVIPCLNESGRIGPFLEELCAQMEFTGDVDIMVVNDGSDDLEQGRMERIVEPLRIHYTFLLPILRLNENLGKGAAVYAGWKQNSQAALLAFVDADGSCSASETARIIQEARLKPQIAHFASRVKMLGYRIQRLFKRHIVGRVYATIVSEMLNLDVYDSQCGLKIVPAKAYYKIADSLTINRFAFDVDLLVQLIDSDCRVNELPINWHEEPNGKVHLLRDSWRMFNDVLSIRRNRRSRGKASLLI